MPASPFRRPACALPIVAAVLAALIIPPVAARPGARPQPPASPTAAPAPALPRVLVEERPGTANVAIEVRVRGAGPGGELPMDNGVSHFIEHLLFKGTPTLAPGALDAAVERLGGELIAYTSRDATKLSLSVPVAAWREVLALLADALRHPAFRPEDIEAERAVIVAEMAVAQSDPYRTGFSRLCSVAFPADDPYRLPLMGSPENVARFTPDDLRLAHQRLYRPENITLTLVGDVTADAVRTATRELWTATSSAGEGAAAGTPPPSVPFAASGAPDPLERVARSPDQDQIRPDGATSVYLVFKAPPPGDPDAASAEVLAALLGRSAAGDGWLARRMGAREPRILAATAEYVPLRRSGLLLLSATASGGLSADDLEAALLAQAAVLREDGIGESDLFAAQGALIGQALYDQETPEGQARRMADADALGLSPEHVRGQINRVRAVSAEDVRQIARRYLVPNRRAVAVVGSRTAGEATR